MPIKRQQGALGVLTARDLARPFLPNTRASRRIRPMSGDRSPPRGTVLPGTDFGRS
jgi:hypothetical protein